MRHLWLALWLLAAPAFAQTIGPTPGGGTGTVTSVSNPSVFGVTCSVATATTTPAITCTAGAPSLGAATATSLNGLTFTSSTGTFTLAAAKTLTVNNTLTLTGTDSSNVAFGAGGTVLYGNQAITLSSDCTGTGTTSIAAICTKTNGVSFGALATLTPGTGVATALGNAVNTSGGALTSAAPDGQTIVFASNKLSTSVPDTTFTSNHTIAVTDMGGQVNMNGSSLTVTIPAISSTVFAANMTSIICNYAASTVTISTTPTINGYTPSTIPAVSGGIASCLGLTSNGVSLDAVPTSGGGGGGSGTVSSGTVGQIGVYAGSGTTISGQTVASGVVLKGQGAAVPVASAIADNGSNVAISEAALTTPVALTDGATIATNAALSNVFTVTIAGNRTLSNPTNLVAGQFITWQLKEDATGSRTLALDTDFNLINGGTFAMNSAANAKTTLSCFVDTTSTLQCAGGAPLSTITTGSNCSSSAAPAVCGSASGGSVAVPTGTNPTLTVNTTAVTANSQIIMNIDESIGTRLSVTCNTTLTTLTNPVITARTPGTSFTVQIGATIAVNPACASFVIVN